TKILNLAFRCFIGSNYVWQKWMCDVKDCISILFGSSEDSEKERNAIEKENQALTKIAPLRARVDRCGLLLQGLRVLTYITSGVIAFALGTAFGWREVARKINYLTYWLFHTSSPFIQVCARRDDKKPPDWAFSGLLPLITS